MTIDEDHARTVRSVVLARQVGCGAAWHSFSELVSEALTEKLAVNGNGERPWMKSFGKLRALCSESSRINEILKAEFDLVGPEDLQ